MADIEVAGLVAKISIDDSDLEQSMASLNRQMRISKSEFQATSAGMHVFGKGTDGLKMKSQGLSKQLEIQGARVAKLQEEHAKSVDEKGKDAVATQKLETQLNKSVAEYNKLHGELQRVNKELAVQSSSWTTAGQALEKAGGKMQSIGKGMESAGNALTKTVTAPLLAVGGLAFKTAMDWESAFAGTRKTIEMTEAQFAELATGIRDMAKEMPMAATEIAGIAEAAGQLGIENESILSFTRVMADLGVSTNMSAETAATSLARLANITQMPQENFDRLGSTTVALGNALATTESEIVEMGLRIAGAGKQVGMTEADILSFAGALSSLGVESQAGGSSISKLMIDMSLAVETGGESLKDFAKVAGMSTKDFQKAFKDDATGAIIEFITGLSTAEERGMSAIKILDDMGIKEVRLRDSLLRAAGAGELFANSIELGNKAWAENTALTDEASQRYEITESQLQILKNRLTDTGITLGQELIPAVMDALDAAEPLFKAIESGAKAFADMDTAQQRTILKWAGLAIAAGPVLSVTGKMTQTVGTLATGLGKTSKWIGSFATASKGASIAASGVASATSGAAGATAGFASLLNPLTIGLGVAAVAVGGLAYAYHQSIKPAKDAGEAAVEFLEGVASWESDVMAAESALAGLNTETIISTERMSELESSIRKAQQNIIGIAETAAKESRAYTEEERKQIEELVGLIQEYTEEKLEAYTKQQELVIAMATSERDITIERANELAKGAIEAREGYYQEIETAYANEIALAEETWGHLGEVDKKAYDEAIENAQKIKDERIVIADAEYGESLGVIQEKYADFNTEDMKYLEQLAEAGEEVKRIEEEKTKYIEEQSEKRALDKMDESTRIVAQWVIEQAAHWKFNKESKEAYKDLEEAYDESKEANLDTWLAMVFQTEQYGGSVSAKTERVANGVIDSFEAMPDDAKKAARDTMQGVIDGMDSKQGNVFSKAGRIGRGLLNRFKRALDINSPSGEMMKASKQMFEGLEIPMKEAEIKLPKKMGKIALDMLDATKPPPMPETINRTESVTRNYSTQKVDHSGTIRVEGVNNRNELMGVVELVKEELRWEARMA